MFIMTYFEKNCMVTKDIFGSKILLGESLGIFGNFLSLVVIVQRPFNLRWQKKNRILLLLDLFNGYNYLFNEIREISLEWDVMNVRFQLTVKVFVIRGVLLKNNSGSRQQIRKPIRCNCSVDIDLIFILKIKKWV